MPNIKFHYLYRDGGNYKNFGYVILNNPNNLNLEEAEQKIKERLVDSKYFYVKEWDLPDLRFPDIDVDNDPTWHEFQKLEFTNEPATLKLL